MIKKITFMAICFVAGLFLTLKTTFAITPQQLQEMLEQGSDVTIVDIRSIHAFQANHITGAINIPAKLISTKRLPQIGRVIVCGDGIHTNSALGAVETLNRKPGIQADILEGGFAAWEALNLQTIRPGGFKREKLHYISYRDFEGLVTRETVLIDLRDANKTGGKALTDLSGRYPGINIIKLSANSQSKKFSLNALAKNGKEKLYLLIDNGNAEAEKIAHRLKAAGIRRVAILAGGERVLRRNGRPGLGIKKYRD